MAKTETAKPKFFLHERSFKKFTKKTAWKHDFLKMTTDEYPALAAAS